MHMPHDQTWFFLKAVSIAQGNWLGETYDHYTLIKGPVYPAFLAGLSLLGINPKLGTALLYIIASIAFLFAMKLTIKSRIGLIVGFALVLGNPVTFSHFWSETLRLNLFIPLVLLFISALLALTNSVNQQQPKLPLFWTILCGISLGLALNTRAEAIWLFSGFAPLALITIRDVFKFHRLKPWVFIWILLTAFPVLINQKISNLNKEYYGKDYATPAFGKAVAAINSLNTVNDTSVYYLTPQVRDKLMQISQNTNELATQLFGENRFKDTPDQYFHGSYSSWGIRSAMARNGYYSDAKTTQAAYEKIYQDIRNYCLENTDSCQSTFMGFIVKPKRVAQLPEHMTSGINRLTRFEHFTPPQIQSMRDRGDLGFQYTVNRFFNMNVTWDKKLDSASGINEVEQKRLNRIKKTHKAYQKHFATVLYTSLLLCLLTLICRVRYSFLNTLLLFGLFAGSFSVFLLVSLLAVPGFPRLLSLSATPMLCFSAYFLAFGWETIVQKLKTSLQPQISV